ncbi:hypothetical protein ACLVWU_03175 [Bdellovibrio sp. HCB290]|uniref:hypothetical protein n=1 Tax=Bdellovibrio sp. HCB290 TaxID=3394356 RepID=UPI0039B64614
MKKLFVALMTLMVVACGDSGGGGGNGVATTPVQGDTRCITSSTLCNNGVYSQYTGWMPYTFPNGGVNNNYLNYFQSYGVCGCPLGYAPAYNSVMGMGCYRVQTGFNWNIFYQFQYNNYSSMPYGFYAPQSGYNFQQVSNIPGGNGANCSGNIATSCLMNQANSCGAGQTCQEVLVGSGLGVCTTGQNYNWGYQQPGYNYNYNYNPGYYPYGGAGFGVGFGVGFGFGF